MDSAALGKGQGFVVHEGRGTSGKSIPFKIEYDTRDCLSLAKQRTPVGMPTRKTQLITALHLEKGIHFF